MKKILFFFFILTSPIVSIFAQKANYSGVWKLNLEKSKLEHISKEFTGSQFIIKQTEDRIKLTRYHFKGKKKNKMSFSMIADGKTRRVKLLFKGKLEWKENTLEAILWRKNFSNTVNYKFGNNNNELIADEVFIGYPQNHHNIWVFDREK